MVGSSWRETIFETEAALSEIATMVPKDESEDIYEFIRLHREAYAQLAHAVTTGNRQKISAASGEETSQLERLIASQPESTNGMAIWLTYIAAIANSRGSDPFLSGTEIANFLRVVKAGMEKVFWRL